MQLLSADAIVFSKKQAKKVAHNWPKPFIPQPSPTHSQQPKIDFSYHKNVPPDICSLICGATKAMAHVGLQFPLCMNSTTLQLSAHLNVCVLSYTSCSLKNK